MIDPMATGTVKRPSADVRRPRGREALSTHPPTPADDTTSGSLEQPPENTRAPAALQQILCGKLEGVDQMLVRDVFDVLTVGDEQPAALAAAAGRVFKQRAAAVESAWRNAAGLLADRFHDSIRGAPRRRYPARPEAAAAFQAHRYTRLEIDLHSDTLSIRKTISAGFLEPETYAARNAGRAPVESRRGHSPQQQPPRRRLSGFPPPSGLPSTPAANVPARLDSASRPGVGAMRVRAQRGARQFSRRRRRGKLAAGNWCGVGDLEVERHSSPTNRIAAAR